MASMEAMEVMTPDQRVSAEVLKSLAKHFNCLNEDNKIKRKTALEAIKKETIDKGLSSGVLQEVFSCLLKSLLKCLSDPMERCRETAIRMLGEFICCVPRPEESLPYIIPCLAQRIGREKIVEPAEELRLSIMDVLVLTVEVCGRHLAPYLDDMINILQRTIIDPFPDVKRESCKCTVNFAKCVPEHFHMQADSLVKPLMQTINHQRSTVRVTVIEATGTVIQYGTGKSVDDVLPRLAERLLDDSPQVRKAVTVVVGNWLLHMSDRYSYFNKLLPLLLCSLSDEILEIRLLAADLWRQTGAQWEKENEDKIKDKMDFLLSPPPLYPAGVERPGLGCRELVVRNMSWMVAGITRDLTDWLVGPQIKASQLLSMVLLHAEDRCTEQLQRLLATLYQACSSTEKQVATNCLEAAKLLGTFVAPEVFLKLLLEQVESNSFSCPWVPLAVLSPVLGGCSGPLLRPHLQQIADTLSQPNVCQVYHRVEYLEQLLSCVDVLVCQCGPDCGPVSLQLLQVLVTVQSLSTEPLLSDKALECVQCLCKVQNLASVAELYRRHMDRLLAWLADTVSDWSSYSPQRLQLQVIATQSGPVIGEFVPQVMPLLQSCLHPDRDPEMRLMIFTMLAKLLLDAANTLDSQKCFSTEAETFLHTVLLPNLVWHGGRTFGAIRTATLSCLLALLHGGAITPTQLLCAEEKLTPQVLSALEEQSQMARLFACRSLYTMLRLIGPGLHPHTLNKIYPEVLKRLDDSSEEVRAMALRTLDVWLSSLTKDYNPQHLEFLFQQLLLHLDDSDATVQEQVLEVLKKGSLVCPALMKREVEVMIEKHRSRFYCDQLLQHIDTNSHYDMYK